MALSDDIDFTKCELVNNNGIIYIVKGNFSTVAFNSAEDLCQAISLDKQCMTEIFNKICSKYEGLKRGIDKYGIETTVKIFNDCIEDYDIEIDNQIFEDIYKSENMAKYVIKYMILSREDSSILKIYKDRVIKEYDYQEGFISGSKVEQLNKCVYKIDFEDVDPKPFVAYLMGEEHNKELDTLELGSDRWLELVSKYISKLVEYIEDKIIKKDAENGQD